MQKFIVFFFVFTQGLYALEPISRSEIVTNQKGKIEIHEPYQMSALEMLQFKLQNDLSLKDAIRLNRYDVKEVFNFEKRQIIFLMTRHPETIPHPMARDVLITKIKEIVANHLSVMKVKRVELVFKTVEPKQVSN